MRIASLEVENQNLHGVVQDLQQAISKLEARLSSLEKSSPTPRATAPQTQVSLPAWEGALNMSWLLSLPSDCPRQSEI